MTKKGCGHGGGAVYRGLCTYLYEYGNSFALSSDLLVDK